MYSVIMRKVFVIAVICALSLTGIQAQNNIHSWKMGALSWKDFAPNGSIGNKHSHMEYYMGIQGSMSEKGGVKYLHPTVTAFMSNEYSWADPAFRTPRLLAYHQCAFDLVELHRRQLENYLMSGKASFLELIDPDHMVDNAMQQVGEEIALLKAETAEGGDSIRLSQWQALVKQQLDTTTLHTFTEHRDAPMRWGLAFDGGIAFIGGHLHDYLEHGLAFGFTGDVGYRRHFLTTALSMGGSRCFDTVYHTEWEINDLYPSDPILHLNYYFAYGYAVVDNAYLRLVPFIGFGRQKFYYNGMDDSSHGPSDGCLHVGVDFHYNISNQVELNELLCRFRYNARHDLVSFHTKLYATYNRFEQVIGSPTGFTVNLQLGVSLMTGRAHCE